jgi:hypothetical protein
VNHTRKHKIPLINCWFLIKTRNNSLTYSNTKELHP